MIEVVECGSINKAASKLFISQQALRSSITALERDLGFKILIRTKKGVELTSDGEKVVNDIRNILGIAQKWSDYGEEGTSDDQQVIKGTVHVATTPLASNVVLYDVIKKCREIYPELYLRAHMCRKEEMISFLKENRMIGMLISIPLPQFHEEVMEFASVYGYQVEPLWFDHLEIFLNADHPYASQSALSIEQLRDLTLVIYPDEDKYSPYQFLFRCFSHDRPYTFVSQYNIFYHIANDVNCATVFSRTGEGLKNLYNFNFTHLPIQDYQVPEVCCLIYPKKNTLSRIEKISIQLLRDQLIEYGKSCGVEIQHPKQRKLLEK